MLNINFLYSRAAFMKLHIAILFSACCIANSLYPAEKKSNRATRAELARTARNHAAAAQQLLAGDPNAALTISLKNLVEHLYTRPEPRVARPSFSNRYEPSSLNK